MELMAKLSHSAKPLPAVPASGGRELPPAPDPATQGGQKQIATPTRKQPSSLLHGISQRHIALCLPARVLPPESGPGQSSGQLQNEEAFSHTPHTEVSAPPRESHEMAMVPLQAARGSPKVKEET